MSNSCWMSVETHLPYIIHGPIMAALLVSQPGITQSSSVAAMHAGKVPMTMVMGAFSRAFQVNLFFLLNIVRVLVTKLRDTHRAESNMYMKAVRATLILVPLLGIQFVIIPWRPENRLAGEVFDYIMHILMNYQVLIASATTTACSLNTSLLLIVNICFSGVTGGDDILLFQWGSKYVSCLHRFSLSASAVILIDCTYRKVLAVIAAV